MVQRCQVPGSGYRVASSAYPMCAFSVLGARYPAPVHGGMRGEGDATFPHASPTPRAENRRPDTESGARYLAPDTWMKGRDLDRIPGACLRKTRTQGMHPASIS